MTRSKRGWFARAAAATLAALATANLPAGAAAPDQPPPERPMHVYLEVRISPDAAFVAAVEGNAPPGGYYPVVRDLAIRRINGTQEARIPLPCGRVPQC